MQDLINHIQDQIEEIEKSLNPSGDIAEYECQQRDIEILEDEIESLKRRM